MRDLLGDLEGQLPMWERVVAGEPDWRRSWRRALVL